MARLKLKAQILKGDLIAFGPGKADLLDAIDSTGSITKAARTLGMSYRRAWELVDAMNECFRAPLVEARRGGAAHGGARVTPLGREVLQRYRMLERALDRAAAPHVAKLIQLILR